MNLFNKSYIKFDCHDRQTRCCLVIGLIHMCLSFIPPAAAQTFPYTINITEINPNSSTLHASDPNGGSGGRINSVIMSTDSDGIPVYYAASGGGGLYKSMRFKEYEQPGYDWFYLKNHRPVVTWDLAVHPAYPDQIYASSFYDGRAKSLAGINISLDAGRNWKHPSDFVPPAGFCDGESRRLEPSAFGIAVDPDEPKHVFVGTNCGLAVSKDRGGSWSYLDPTPSNPANDVWDVIVHHNGIIDTCGEDGHRRSVDGGNTWTIPAEAPLPRDPCSLAASPYDHKVLFAATPGSGLDGAIYESSDGGTSWIKRYPLPPRPFSISYKPFVKVNKRANETYDLWFGGYELWRRTCSKPTVAGGPHCGTTGWAGPYTRETSGHDLAFDIVFDSRQQESGCPMIYASLGGVYINTKGQAAGCHAPVWEQPYKSPHALALQSMDGVAVPGVKLEKLYLGTETGGVFHTKNAGDLSPIWINHRCCIGYDIVASKSVVLNSTCCYLPGRLYRMFRNKLDMTGEQQLTPYPPGYFNSYFPLDAVDIVKEKRAMAVTSEGVYVTLDITADPIQWQSLGAPTQPYSLCGGKVSVAGNKFRVFVQEAPCTGIGVEGEGGRIWAKTITGTTASSWRTLRIENVVGKFGVFDVDPDNPKRIIASVIPPSPKKPAIILSTDGGNNWQRLSELETKLTGAGHFKARNTRGPFDFFGYMIFDGYVQPSLLAFDPYTSKVIVAGGVDSGVFISLDEGRHWTLITDPRQDRYSSKPHIPRPRFAYFDHELSNGFDVYIGSGGRGVWRIRLEEK